jgi:hypothetical protein
MQKKIIIFKKGKNFLHRRIESSNPNLSIKPTQNSNGVT